MRVFRLTWISQPLLPYFAMLAAIPFMYLILSLDIRHFDGSFYTGALLLSFFVFFCGSGWLYAGLSFSDLSQPDPARRYLMIPATVFEKWLSKTILTFIVFPITSWIVFNAAIALFKAITVRAFAFQYAPIDWSLVEYRAIFFLFFLLLPVGFAAGLMWKRYGIIKTIVSAFALMILLFFLVSWRAGTTVSTSADGSYLKETLFDNIVLPHFLNPDRVEMELPQHLFWIIGFYLPSLLFFAATYFLLKEKEI